MEILNKLPKGSFAFAHVQKSGYSLLAGHYVYSRYFIVQITKATREGEAKGFTDTAAYDSHGKVDRYTSIFHIPAQYADNAKALFAQQASDFTGYETKAELKTALLSLVAAE